MKDYINTFKKKLSNLNFCLIATIVFIFIGILIRIKFYSIKLSLDSDECCLGMNILNSYSSMFEPLVSKQVAPPLFMVGSKFLFHLVHPFHNIVLSDLSLRFIPLISSILSLPLFAILVHKLYRNDYMTLVCTTILALNAPSIRYATTFKQYSTEMLFTIILILAFLAIDFKKVSLKKLSIISLIFAISPWCSGTALPVLISGFIFLLVNIIKEQYYNKTKFLILFTPIIISFITYIFYIIPVINTHYHFMRAFWNGEFSSFFTLSNFAQLFNLKLQALLLYPYTTNALLIFFTFICITILFSRKEYCKNNLFLVFLPILFLIIGSFFCLYPFELRFLLFSLPIFVIIYAQPIFILKRLKITTIILISAMLYLTLNFNFSNIYNTRMIFYTRKIVEIVRLNTQGKNVNLIAPPIASTYYSILFPVKMNEILYNFESSTLEESGIPNIINKFDNGDYWIYAQNMAFNSTQEDLYKQIKEYIYQNKHIEVLKEWSLDKYRKDPFLIHFKYTK